MDPAWYHTPKEWTEFLCPKLVTALASSSSSWGSGDHHLTCNQHQHFSLAQETIRTSPLSKQGRLRAGVGGYINLSCPICWLLLPHTVCNGSGSTKPEFCSPERVTENQGVWELHREQYKGQQGASVS